MPIVPIISAPRELSIATGAALIEQVAEVIAAGAPAVVVDCAGVEMVDSGGIGALLQADRHARDCSAFVLVINLHGDVATLLDLTRATDTLFVGRPARDHHADAATAREPLRLVRDDVTRGD